MKKPAQKGFSFISGLLIGMLSAVLIIFLVNMDINPVRFISGSSRSPARDTIVDLTRKAKTRTPKISQTPGESKDAEFLAASSDEKMPEIHSEKPDTVKFEAVGTDEIYVKRDELLELRNLELTILDKVNAQKAKTDSLIRNFQGAGPQSTNYRMELWKSPVNYRGFKLIRNSLITFGLDKNENSRLYQLDEKLYLRHGQAVYRLFPTDEFEPFSRVLDEDIIRQLR